MARSRLRFATINLHNLQRPGRPTYPGTRPLDDGEYRARLRFLRLMLEATDADVYGFQELWAADALADLLETAGMADAYETVARDAPGPGRPQVALAARRGMIAFEERSGTDDSFWIEPFPDSLHLEKRRSIDRVSVSIDRFSRPLLEAMVQPAAPSGTPPVRVIVAHLKSKRPIRLDREERNVPEIARHGDAIGSALASIRRTAEAAALRAMLNERMLDNNLPHVVMGDMNNGSASVSTGIITGDPRYKLIDTSRQVYGRRADLGLYSVEQLQQYRSQRHTTYTHIFENRLDTLDHILVSEELYDHSVNRIWSFVEARVFNDHLSVPHERGEVDAEGHWVTDHGIVDATFEHNPFRPNG